MTIPGTLLAMPNFKVPTTGSGFAVIARFTPDGRDALVLTVWPDGTQPWPGPTPPTFTANRMMVAFHKTVPAPKEMSIFDLNEQNRITDRLDRSSDSVRWHDLAVGDTLQFKKFDAGSNLRAVYRLDKDEFWSAFNGHLVLFNWVTDG